MTETKPTWKWEERIEEDLSCFYFTLFLFIVSIIFIFAPNLDIIWKIIGFTVHTSVCLVCMFFLVYYSSGGIKKKIVRYQVRCDE